MMGGRPELYGDLLIDLQNQYLIGIDNFPRSLTEAYNIMANFIPKQNLFNNSNQNSSFNNHGSHHNSIYSLGMGMTFFQTEASVTTEAQNSKSVWNGKGKGDSEDLVPGTNGVLFPKIRCYCCNYFGHYADRCEVVLMQTTPFFPETATDIANNEDGDDTSTVGTADTVGFSFCKVNVTLAQVNHQDRYKNLKPTWVLLDTQSSCDIFVNKWLLHNIWLIVGDGLLIHSNGVNFRATKMGTVKGYGDVWYNKHSLANILSFTTMRKKFPITVSTRPDDSCPTILS